MNNDYAEAVRLIRKGRRAEESGKAMRGCITSMLTSALTALFHGWTLMVAVGVLHAGWWPAVPTIGYWWAVLTVVLLRGVFSHPQPTKKAQS